MPPARITHFGVLGAVAATALGCGPAVAQDRPFAAPPEITIQRGGAPSALTGPLGAAPGTGARQASLDLAIRYVSGRLYNPNSASYDSVKLRGYVDRNRPPADGGRVIGPNIRVRPGDTVRMTLHNELPKDDPSCPAGADTHDTPGCFNNTNLHSHGLWVSPTGNSDNVLLDIKPGQSFPYEYNIPLDHPAGTFWYHPHRHGSTAIQVSSGMAGALIIEGNRPPGDRPEQTGDIDLLTRGMPEKLLVLDQTAYACSYQDGVPSPKPDGPYDCSPGQVGSIESASQFNNNWSTTGRFTSINGVVQPLITLTAGQVERWRLVHAGIGDSVIVRLARLKPGTTVPAAGVAAAQEVAFARASCDDASQPLFEIQADGLTRAQVAPVMLDTLQPGYRSDLLVAVPEPGRYCLLDMEAPATDETAKRHRGIPEGTRLLGIVHVLPNPKGKVTADAARLVRDALVGNAEARLQGRAKARVLAELRDTQMLLTSFVPHRTITEAEITIPEPQRVVFDVVGKTTPQPGDIDPYYYYINGKSYDPEVVDRVLPLGGVQEWRLSSLAFSHPFHIHVNPFQVVGIFALAADGTRTDVTDPAIPYAKRLAAAGGDPQYLGLRGVWKDTLFVVPGFDIVTRTRYQRYIGEFVLHCHILDHEDRGMMQNVSIVPPGAVPARRKTVAHSH